MDRYLMEATGKSKSEARDKILEEIGISEEALEWEVVSGGKSLFGLGNKPVTLRATIKDDIQISTENAAAAVALTLIRKMGYKARVAEKKDIEGKAYVKITSPNSGVLIGKRGKNLESIQFLTDMIVSRILSASPGVEKKRIILDIGDYRAKRQSSLENLAQSMSEKVIESGRSRLLEPMNPFERRIIHLALQEHHDVYTKSEGVGVYKKVRISLLPQGMTKEDFLRQEAEAEQAAAEAEAEAETAE